MATTAELSTIISNRLIPKYIDALVWSDITTAVSAITTGDRTNIVNAVKSNDAADLGRIIFKAVRTYIETQALAEANTMMSDNTLDFTEINRLLG